MKNDLRVYLVGPMGAGKTTIGRQLAKALGAEFLDSDHEIEQRTGATIPWIFDIEGEDGFRRREMAVIDELTQRSNVVVATGGGAVLLQENRSAMHERGIVVYLYASIDKLVHRTARDRNRPLLQTEDPRQRLVELMEVRDPLYRDVADLVVDTGSRSLRQTVASLARKISRLQHAQADKSSEKPVE